MTIRHKLATGLAFSAMFLTAIAAMPMAQAENMRGAEVVTNGPRVNPGDRAGAWSAERNVRDSQRYEATKGMADKMNATAGPADDRLHCFRVACNGGMAHGAPFAGFTITEQARGNAPKTVAHGGDDRPPCRAGAA